MVHGYPIQYIVKNNEIVSYEASNDSLFIFFNKADDWIRNNTINIADSSRWLIDYTKRVHAIAEEDSILKAAKNETHTILEQALITESGKQYSKKSQDSIKHLLEYDSKKIKPYVLQLHKAYFSAKVSNDYFINRYQPYLNYQGQYKFPELGGLLQGGLSDLLENHHFNIGFRLPISTEGSDFFFHYENTSKKIDWGLSFFRKVESQQPDSKRDWKDENGRPFPNFTKIKTHYYELSLTYPLTYESALSMQTAVRRDRTIFLATDKYSLDFENIESVWSITTLSYKLNKLRPTLPMLNKGYEVKGILDVFKGFSQKELFLMGNTLHVAYHLPIYKYITLVTQVHGGYSGGDANVLYNLGGIDNNLTQRIDSNVHFSQDAPYAFINLVTPFRGYLQNRLYGYSYALVNYDLYFPIFQTLIPIETPLPSINNLQLGLFSDIANAWRDEKSNNNSWKYSFGMSARTILAGYPLRIDVAWPGTFSKEPLWYFSLKL